MRNTLETRLGIFFALTFVAAVIVLEMAGGADFFKPSYTLRSRFSTAQELKKGDPVKMAGVEIGRVDDIRFADNEDKVEIVLKVRRGTTVKTDAKATIKFAGLLGQNFVAVTMGSSKTALENDQLIQSAEQPDLSAMMEKLNSVATGIEKVTASFSGDSIQNILGPFTDFLKQNQTRLTGTIANMEIVSKNLAEGKGTVGKLLTDDTLYTSALKTVNTLNDTAADVKGMMGDAKGMVNDVKGFMTDTKGFVTNANSMMGDARAAIGDARLALGDARKSIGKMDGIFDDTKATVKEAQETMKEARIVVTDLNAGKGTLGKLAKDPALHNEALAAVTNLKEIFQKINQGQGSIGKFVNDESFFKNAKMTLQKVDKATEELEDTGPLSVLTSVIGKLF